MARYRPDPRYADLPYRDGPPPPGPQRWDRDTFVRERDYVSRGPPAFDRYDDPYRSPPPRRSGPIVAERERVYEDDRYGPRGERDVKYYEEDYYRSGDPRAAGGAMVPFAAPPPARPAAVPRMVRRQSSLDFYDRRGPRRYADDGYYEEPYSPRGGAGAGQVQRRFDEVQIQDPYYYGDDGFREYREREWVRHRSNSRSRSRSRPRTEVAESVRETVIEKEKPYPRRGKTRMPKRLVHTKVLFDLGYPYYEEVSFWPFHVLVVVGVVVERG